MTRKRSADRRVRRTRSLLHEALASLIHQKPYEDIVVKEILARADVGRSTFYSHFHDKDELLESGIRDMVRTGAGGASTRSTSAADDILRFSLPLFAHIERYRDTITLPAARADLGVVHDRLEREVTLLVAHALEEWSSQRPNGGGRAQRVPSDLLARHVGSTFRDVLDWWLGSAERIPAREANELFRSLALPALGQVTAPLYL
jgi:Transcriptional regulator